MDIVESVKSESATTEWSITSDGRLKETGKDSYTFVLSKRDTATLLKLLMRHSDLILAGLQVHQDGTHG